MNFNCYKYIGVLFILLSWYKCWWKVDLTMEFNISDQASNRKCLPTRLFD